MLPAYAECLVLFSLQLAEAAHSFWHQQLLLERLQDDRGPCCQLQLQYAAKRGFYLSTAKPGAPGKPGGTEVPPLPKEFIQVDALRSRSAVTCTTHKLNALNSRLSDASADCMVLTEQVHPLKVLHHHSMGRRHGNAQGMIQCAPGYAPFLHSLSANKCVATVSRQR